MSSDLRLPDNAGFQASDRNFIERALNDPATSPAYREQLKNWLQAVQGAVARHREIPEIPEAPGGPDTPDTPDTPDVPNVAAQPASANPAPQNGSYTPNLGVERQNAGVAPPSPGTSGSGGSASGSAPVPQNGSPAPNLGVERQNAGAAPPAPGTANGGGSTPGSAAPSGAPGAGAQPVGLPSPENVVDASTFGVSESNPDNTAAIQAAVDAAKPGQTVLLPAGNFKHSGTITLKDGVTLSGSGAKTVLEATNPDKAAIIVTGSNAGVSNLTARVNAADRGSQPEQAAILVQNASGAKVSNVTTDGAKSNGVRIDNSTNSLVENTLVVGSNADGIALMNGSSNNEVRNSTVFKAGDDSFSDVSYERDAKQDSGNRFTNITSLHGRYGSGLKLAGVTGDSVDGLTVIGGPGGGVINRRDPASATRESTNNSIKNSVAIDIADDGKQANDPNKYGAFVNASDSSNRAYSSGDPAAARYLSSAGQFDESQFTYNRNYRPGTGDGANNGS